MASDKRYRSFLSRFFRSGDTAAMEELVAATRPRLLAAARKIGAPQDAEDSVQGAYHALLRRGSLPEGPVFPWLLVTAIRIAYRRKAMARRERRIVAHLAHPRETPAGAASRAEEEQLLRREVARLPARYRDVVVLHHLEGLPVAETARMLEVARSTVTTRLRRARRLLRGRLAPLLSYGVLCVPWFMTDVLARTAPIWGGTMKAKGAFAIAGAAVAAGAVGLGVGASMSDASPPRMRSAAAERRVQELEAEVELLRQEAAQAHLDAVRRTPPATAGTKPERNKEASSRLASNRNGTSASKMVMESRKGESVPDPIPEKVIQEAETLEVSEEVMNLAWKAHRAYRVSSLRRKPDEKLLPALEVHGEEAFRALVAITRGGEGGTWMESLFAAVWKPGMTGLERLLIETADRKGGWRAGTWTALRALGVVGTHEAREYLVGRIRNERDGRHFMAIAAALGQLRDGRAIEYLERGIRNKYWHKKVRWQGLAALVKIEGEAATTRLLNYLRERESDMLRPTLDQLVRLDRTLAVSEAKSLLEVRRETLTSDQLSDLRRFISTHKPAGGPKR